MTTLRNAFSIAVTVATLGFGSIAASPASAYGFHRGGFHHHFSHIGHRHFGWGHRHFGHRWSIGHRWGYHRSYGYRYGHRWGGYRRVVSVGVGVASVPRTCPAGTHLGYNGKFCWPNR